MSEKVKDNLIKMLAYYYDIKHSVKYLIYFNKQQQTNTQVKSQAQALTGNESVMMVVTDGFDCWRLCIDDQKFINNIVKVQLNEKISYTELLSHLINSLTNEKFELNQILNSSNENSNNEQNSDMIEFKFTINNITNKNQSVLKCNLLLEPVLSAKSKANEIKNLLFFVHQKFSKTELELKRIKDNSANGQNDANITESASSSEISSLTRSNSNDIIKARFGLKVNSGSGNLPRKPGMSIINPFSKRRKTPGGITFDDDENESDEEGSATNSQSS